MLLHLPRSSHQNEIKQARILLREFLCEGVEGGCGVKWRGLGPEASVTPSAGERKGSLGKSLLHAQQSKERPLLRVFRLLHLPWHLG